jgi:hypothetical protein
MCLHGCTSLTLDGAGEVGAGGHRELPPGGSRSWLVQKLTQRRAARLRGRFVLCIKQVSPKLLPPVAQCLASSMEAVEMSNSLISRFSDGLEPCLFVLHHVTYFTWDIPSPTLRRSCCYVAGRPALAVFFLTAIHTLLWPSVSCALLTDTAGHTRPYKFSHQM